MLVRKQLEDQRVSCGDGRDDGRTLITPLGERDEVLMRDIGLKRDMALCDFSHLCFGTVMVDCGEEDGGTNVVSDNQHISNETIPFVPSLPSLIQSLQSRHQHARMSTTTEWMGTSSLCCGIRPSHQTHMVTQTVQQKQKQNHHPI